MSRRSNGVVSRRAAEALAILGNAIRTRRLLQRIKTTDLAERAGISRGLLARIERGEPSCAIGIVFEVATILGLPLIDGDAQTRIVADDRLLALLPRAIRDGIPAAIDDDF